MNEDFSEFLSRQARSPTAAIHEFRLLYSPSSTAIHAFLEGDDDRLYYLPEIRPRLKGREIQTYDCGGKRGVEDARTFIRSQGYDHAHCLYFVDRDYDDLFGRQISEDPSTYVTDYYSIENELVSIEVAEIVLADLVGLRKNDRAFLDAIGAFGDAQAKFARKLEPFLAWCLAMRAAGERPNFNNVDLKKVFKIEKDGSIVRLANARDIFQKAVRSSQSTAFEWNDVVIWCRRLRVQHIKCRIRGKFELWFFQNYLAAHLSTVKIKRGAATFITTQRAMFEVLSGRLRGPDSLRRFLDAALK